MSELRDAYKQWGEQLLNIMRDPTDAEIAALMPIDHPLHLKDMTVGEWLDFRNTLWRSKQIRDVITLLMEAKA